MNGGSGNDNIDGSVNTQGNATWSVSDAIDGGAGVDTLSVTLNNGTSAASYVLNASVKNVENFVVTNNGSGVLTADLLSTPGLSASNVGSAGGLVFNNIGNLGASEVRSTAGATTFNLLNKAIAGDSDDFGIKLAGVTGAITVSDTAGANSLETLTLDVAADSTISTLTLTDLGLSALNVKGAGALTISTLTDSSPTVALKTFDASENTGGVSFSVVSTTSNTVTGGSGADTITGGSGNDSISGGAGNDVITTGAGVDNIDAGAGNDMVSISAQSNLTSADTIIGGDGTDTMRIFGSTSDGTFENVSGFEVVSYHVGTVTTAQTPTVNVADLPSDVTTVGISSYNFDTNAALAETIAFSNASSTVNTLNISGITTGTTASHASGEAITVTFARQADTTDDALTINLGSVSAATAAFTASGATSADSFNITASGEDQVTLNSVGAANTINALSIAGAAKLTLTGNKNITVSSLTAGLLADVDASAATGDVSLAATSKAATILGGSGDDTFTGSANADNISGGAGADTLAGGGGTDVLNGNEGNDQLTGGSGNDVIDGGDGDDLISGSSGTDVLSGGSGSDSFRFDTISNITSADKIDGGEGTDVIITTATTVGLNGTLLNGAANLEGVKLDGTAAQTVTVTDLVMGAFNSSLTITDVDTTAADIVDSSGVLNSNSRVTLVASSAGSTFTGGNAQDYLVGSSGVDSVKYTNSVYLSATDILQGGAGSDVLYLNTGSTDATYTAAQLAGVSGFERITFDGLSAGATTADVGITLSDANAISNRSSANVFTVDRLNAAGTPVGDDTGKTTINASDVLSVKMTLAGGAGANTLTGGALADTITGGSGNDVLSGQDGADSISGGGGVDNILGGDGADTIIGGDGADIMTGGDGKDVFIVGSLSQTGNEIIDFNAGTSAAAGVVDRLAFDVTGSGETGAFVVSTATSALAKAATDATSTAAAVTAGTTVVVTSVSAANVNTSANVSDALLLAAGTNVIVFQADTGINSLSSLVAAVSATQAAGSYHFDAGLMTNGTAMIGLYDKGNTVGVAVINFSAATAQSSASATAVEVVELTGISNLSNIDASDFSFV